IPDLKFSDIVGNERGVRQISRAIGWLQHPGRIGRFGFRPPGGYLLAGPPGTGKTFLARAAAGECGLPFFSINSAELLSPGAGVAESKLRDLFANARRLAPSIIFIDEIDAIGQQRRSGDYHGIVNTLLGEMDGFSGHSR
ncbi:AAA family ATPase, partial [Oleiphilus sp. HI0123]